MPKRKMQPRRKDGRVFSNTAMKTKKVNVGVTNYRGGIRF